MASKLGTRGRKAIVAAQEEAAQKPPEGVTVPKRRRLPKKQIPTTQEERIEEIVVLMLKHKWDHRVTPFELARKWGCTLSTIAKAAERASARIVIATGTMERRVAHYMDELEEIKADAMAAGQYTAAVRAVELKLKATGVFNRNRPTRPKEEDDRNPRGLPPELAQLDPEPTLDEVEHFASTPGATACQLQVCRVHSKAAPATEQMH